MVSQRFLLFNKKHVDGIDAAMELIQLVLDQGINVKQVCKEG